TRFAAMTYAKLDSKSPGDAGPIYALIVNEQQIQLYSGPPPFDFNKWLGVVGKQWKLKRTQRGLFRSRFELTQLETSATEDEARRREYVAPTRFGDFLEVIAASR